MWFVIKLLENCIFHSLHIFPYFSFEFLFLAFSNPCNFANNSFIFYSLHFSYPFFLHFPFLDSTVPLFDSSALVHWCHTDISRSHSDSLLNTSVNCTLNVFIRVWVCGRCHGTMRVNSLSVVCRTAALTSGTWNLHRSRPVVWFHTVSSSVLTDLCLSIGN